MANVSSTKSWKNHNRLTDMFRFGSPKIKFSTLGAVGSLLETLGDKDDSVRGSIEHALTRMCEKRPNDTLDALSEFKQRSPKLSDLQTAILLRFVIHPNKIIILSLVCDNT